jgi:hypothetical protein
MNGDWVLDNVKVEMEYRGQQQPGAGGGVKDTGTDKVSPRSSVKTSKRGVSFLQRLGNSSARGK